jgi:hypothetical protein
VVACLQKELDQEHSANVLGKLFKPSPSGRRPAKRLNLTGSATQRAFGPALSSTDEGTAYGSALPQANESKVANGKAQATGGKKTGGGRGFFAIFDKLK